MSNAQRAIKATISSPTLLSRSQITCSILRSIASGSKTVRFRAIETVVRCCSMCSDGVRYLIATSTRFGVGGEQAGACCAPPGLLPPLAPDLSPGRPGVAEES